MPSSDYKLYAANGTEIVTYGTKVRNLDIGLRRQFQWPFVIANTNRAIIGADFLNNFGLIIDIKNKRLIDGITNLSIRGVIQSISDMGNISTLNSSSKISAILTKYPNLCRPPSDFVEAKHSVKHYIPTRGQPIHSKARRLDSQRLTLAKAEFQYMLNNGIIRPSNSPWASPLHLVSKKDESLRPCGDYRRLNAVTLPDRYPIPRLDDFHHILKGTRVYSKIDLCKAFYQIPIAEEDKPKTAIITPFGLFEFNVMSFGLRNATATFQRFMHEVLRNLDFAFVYLDDILVASKTEEEHYSHLETLFSRLNSYGLRINLSKSKFLVQEIDFLGYLITSHGVKPLPTKVKAILEYKKPKTVHELRIFLGMLNFYRTFLNNAAETQAILHEYLRGAKKKDRSEIKWTEEAESKKCDLSKLAYELGEVVPLESRIVDLKRLILYSQSYEEEFAKQLLETLIEEREQTEREQTERAERERMEQTERAERERMEQTARTEREQAERIERERKEQMVMEFELEKLRIQTMHGNNDPSRGTSNKAHCEIRKLMPKYESKDSDLSFYLILFERQAKRLGLDEDQWTFSLLGLLPYEMTQLIARETEGQSGDYRFVKRLLLKRYKLSPEQFRQKFEKHDKSQKGSWRDFAFELRGFFNEWIEGMNVENFDALKDLSVTNQLKKKVPNVLRNHLIDDWTKINNPDVLADKLDEYENVRAEMGPPHWNSKHTIPPSFQQKSARFPNRSEVKETEQGTNVSSREAARNEISEKYPNTSRRMVNRAIRNDKGEPKCFNCNQFGHIARDCPVPKATLTCRGCGQTGHKERNCTRPKEGLKVANLEVEGLKTVPPDVYLKDANIDNKETVKAMIDTGSSSCLLRESVARRINVDIEPDSTSLYGIEIAVFIVNDDAQPYDLLIGRTWTYLPYVSFARIGKELHIGYSTEFPFANLQEEIKSRRVELRATETVQLGSDCINFASAITDEVRDGYLLFTGVDDCVNSLLEVVDGKTTVPIISVGKGNLRIKKNQCIGRVELLSPDDIVVNLDVSEDSFQTKSGDVEDAEDKYIGRHESLRTNSDSQLTTVACSLDYKATLLQVQNPMDTFKEVACYRSSPLTRKSRMSLDVTGVFFTRHQLSAWKSGVINCLGFWAKGGLEKREGQDQMKRKRPILPEDVNINHSLTPKERQEILDVVNEYRDCFALGMGELGCTDVTKMDIKEVDGSKPVCLRPYKTTASEREAIREIVREWKDNGIVTETRSPYASPVLLVRKKTGDHRLVVDYRRLNIQIVKDKFPLPKIDDLLEGQRNAKFFTTLDLAHGYLQIPLTDKAKLKTAFITPDDTGQFERMIFGLANAPAEFQRLMHTVLGPLLNKKAFCYLDDVIIPAKDWREMIERLREVLERIISAKLTLKPSKCEFGRREVEFLGYVISTGGLKPGPRKIKAIEEFPKPKNVHDIRRFLGLTNFFRRFVKDFARRAEPLSRLTKKGAQFEWKEEQRRSFGGLRNDLVEYPVLAHYNPELKTEVHCDASAEGLAGMLLQEDEDCKWRLVYCQIGADGDSVDLDRLRQFLVGIKFTVVTDCQALVYMNAKKTTNPQIARWCNLIQEYDFDIRHKPGDKMAHVDGMSRAPVYDPRDTMEEIVEKNLEVCFTITLEEQIMMIQHSDPELRDLIQIFRKDPCDRTVGE
ncbi:hypothetical protein LAZ67_6003487 [Cordylochernes scorpioides]|uniref:RNA-directed DNA polymerase n=1 Tax=Cordylochernes scorpioides TaxID=51811 RepID=A0ABY6KNK7_9ARAC|nr:hypothetical protein LAZ67_6003487 [Cordylochernes scorpioides]